MKKAQAKLAISATATVVFLVVGALFIALASSQGDGVVEDRAPLGVPAEFDAVLARMAELELDVLVLRAESARVEARVAMFEASQKVEIFEAAGGATRPWSPPGSPAASLSPDVTVLDGDLWVTGTIMTNAGLIVTRPGGEFGAALAGGERGGILALSTREPEVRVLIATTGTEAGALIIDVPHATASVVAQTGGDK